LIHLSSHLHYTVRERINNHILTNNHVVPRRIMMSNALSLEIVWLTDTWVSEVTFLDLFVFSVNGFLEVWVSAFFGLTFHTDGISVEIAHAMNGYIFEASIAFH